MWRRGFSTLTVKGKQREPWVTGSYSDFTVAPHSVILWRRRFLDVRALFSGTFGEVPELALPERVPSRSKKARYLLIILRHRRHEAFAEAGIGFHAGGSVFRFQGKHVGFWAFANVILRYCTSLEPDRQQNVEQCCICQNSVLDAEHL